METYRHPQSLENHRYSASESTKQSTITPNAYKFYQAISDEEIHCRQIESPILSVFDSNAIESRLSSVDSQRASQRIKKSHSGLLEANKSQKTLRVIKEKGSKNKSKKGTKKARLSIDHKSIRSKKSKKSSRNETKSKRNIKKISKLEKKRAHSAENYKKTRKIRRNRQEKITQKPGDIISLSIVPENQQKSTFVKSQVDDSPRYQEDFHNMDILYGEGYRNKDVENHFNQSYQKADSKLLNKTANLSTQNLTQIHKKKVKRRYPPKTSSKPNKTTSKPNTLPQSQKPHISSKKSTRNPNNNPLPKSSSVSSFEDPFEQKENRPLQANCMHEGRINRFYKTQRKIMVEEGIIEELQNSCK